MRERKGLFGDVEAGLSKKNEGEKLFDPETAERDNDQQIEMLAQRASLLKSITKDIHDEAERQNSFLDNMQGTMENARNLLNGTLERFGKVFDTKGKKNMLYIVTGMVIGMLLLYYSVF
eukprot:CAMPEP_0114246950 /NCGR_PEP_ID=MMETSP0058-20121206/12753_1 /TAXON_ID=36894 /ORGANISM="Pyramimonas parkeae, CCMP726" /LENGTH=118 /DNA_ID=CAMNT_0001360205 /DNA_START=282 /DNA_END=638 /DNA_ORIENTATION=+